MSKTEKEMIKEMFIETLKTYNHGDVVEVPEGLNLGDITYQDLRDKMVNNPPHYNQGGIETIDYMKAYSTKEEFMGHCRLTAIKYLSRLMEKENPAQDAKKAIWYINKLIEELEDGIIDD